MPSFFMGVAEVAPGVEKVGGDDVIGGVIGYVEVFLLFLKLFLEFLK